MAGKIIEARQLSLFQHTDEITELDPRLWHGSFNGRESTLQQLSPYVGKMKSGMAQVLIKFWTQGKMVIMLILDSHLTG